MPILELRNYFFSYFPPTQVFSFNVDMKLGEKKPKILLFLWLLTQKLSKKSGDLEIRFFFKIWQIWAIFSMEKPLYRLKSYFSA
jgi:hypothetical protein